MPTLIHGFDTPGSTQDWEPVNDGVMGGVSVGQIEGVATTADDLAFLGQ